jgi:hypothetical protein
VCECITGGRIYGNPGDRGNGYSLSLSLSLSLSVCLSLSLSLCLSLIVTEMDGRPLPPVGEQGIYGDLGPHRSNGHG